jgi:hypothetical protein
MQHKLIFVFFSLFAFAATASAQKLVNTPYSRFNLGSIEPNGSFRSLSMGGISTSGRDNRTIFYSNPASYSSLDTNSFVFDFGLDYSINKISDGVSYHKSDDMNFDHLLMGFTIKKGLGVAVGVNTFSNGYYKLSESITASHPDYKASIGEYTIAHSGTGGFNNFFIGSGLLVNKNFSVGLNMNVLFGRVDRINDSYFTESNNSFNNNTTEILKLNGINFTYGLQYTTSFKKDYFLNAGISYNSEKKYNTNYDLLSFRYSNFGTSDTIAHIENISKSTLIPGTIKIGITVGKKNKFSAGADYQITNWSKAIIPGATGTLADIRTFQFGAEFIPDRFSNYSFLKRIEYRIGAHTGDNYLILNGEQLKEYGASFGMGLPLRKTISATNIFIDFTRKTGVKGSLFPTENYITMGISLNFYDFWFIKSKYD